MENLRLIELCSGIGAQAKGIKKTGLYNLESVATSDLDKEVVVSYAAIHCGLTPEMILNYDNYPSKEEMVFELTNKRLGYDFQKDKSYDWEKLSKKKDPTKGIEKYWLADKLSHNLGDMMAIKELPDCDMLTYSTPCFVAGTKVLTENGYKNIEDIVVGDKVLTHTNKYQSVVKTMINHTDTLFEINAMPSDTIKCTGNHPFYIRKMYREWDNSKRAYIRKFKNPEWVAAKDLDKNCYVGVAINQESKLPIWNGIDISWNDIKYERNRTDHKEELIKYFNNPNFWWIVGRFIGDGWVRTYDMQGIVICCDKSETSEITEKLDSLNVKYNVSQERTVNKISIAKKEWAYYFIQFGKGAINKHLTGDILNLPTNLLKGFLDGYWSADGCYTQKLYKASSISRELIYGLGQCIAKVYKKPFRIGYYKRKLTCVIEGRTVNQNDSYSISYKKDKNKQDHAFYEDGYIWCPIKSIKEIKCNTEVYNMEVENDNSYVVQNIIVHNCTDLSIAGKQEGLKWTCADCGSEYDPSDYSVDDRYTCPVCGSHNIKSTRSGLLYEVERLLVKAKDNGNLPKFLLMENVDALVSKKYIDSFNDWISRLDDLGYNSYYQTINAKNAGIPQNRNRIFVISILKDIDNGNYEFPKPFDNGLRLKDMLESDETVTDKYFLSDEVQARLQITDESFKKNIVGTTKPEFRTIGQRDLVYQKDSVMGALVATYYKQPKQILDNEPIHIADLCSERFKKMHDQSRRVCDESGVAPAMHTCGGGNIEPKVARNNLKIVRKLTPLETHRLMGFDDEDYYNCRNVGMSDTQGYRQTGNSIVVNVIALLMEHLYKAQVDSTYVCTDENFTQPQVD